jgi:hypothetical protein
MSSFTWKCPRNLETQQGPLNPARPGDAVRGAPTSQHDDGTGTPQRLGFYTGSGNNRLLAVKPRGHFLTNIVVVCCKGETYLKVAGNGSTPTALSINRAPAEESRIISEGALS